MKKIISVFALSTLLVSCAHIYTSKKVEISSGEIGCPKKDITIEDEEGTSWTAVCNGKKFYCSASLGKDGIGSQKCTPAMK